MRVSPTTDNRLTCIVPHVGHRTFWYTSSKRIFIDVSYGGNSVYTTRKIHHMNWTKWIITAVVVIAVINLIVVSALPDYILGLNIALLAGIFAGVGYLTWWKNRTEQ